MDEDSCREPPSIGDRIVQWLLLFLFGVGIGVLSGMLGIGGGVLVPANLKRKAPVSP